MNFITNNTRNFIVFLLIFILFASRFTGLTWGLPFPMHPDERNMVVAITQLSCPTFGNAECFNPHFYAYGQLPLYLGFIIAPFISLVYEGNSFEYAAIALRIISAVASVITVITLISIAKRITKLTNNWVYVAFLVFTFVPAFIQFSHFGTTESLLMMFYSLILLIAVKFLTDHLSLSRFTKYSAVLLGFALGTKVSALVFAAIPGMAYIFYAFSQRNLKSWARILFEGAKFLILAGIIFIISSPYNILGFQEFVGSMNYESSVGLGQYRAFYTRQFEYSVPILFQFVSIFPYNLGWPIFILSILGFLFLPYKKPLYLFLRLQFIVFFIPNSLFYAKWSRFTSPIFPLMVLFAFLFLHYIYKIFSTYFRKPILFRFIIVIIIFVAIIPAIAYLTIYMSEDVRFKASKWIYSHMPNNSYILSETANVIDVPIINPHENPVPNQNNFYRYISFNFYDLHTTPELSAELQDHIAKADYIFIPSRRVFANHTCYVPSADGFFMKQKSFLSYEEDRCEKLAKDYPQVNNYYDNLFSGKLGFQKVAEFTSYPRIELFGHTILEFPDEMAEETWTVFDHPVIRIYKRNRHN